MARARAGFEFPVKTFTKWCGVRPVEGAKTDLRKAARCAVPVARSFCWVTDREADNGIAVIFSRTTSLHSCGDVGFHPTRDSPSGDQQEWKHQGPSRRESELHCDCRRTICQRPRVPIPEIRRGFPERRRGSLLFPRHARTPQAPSGRKPPTSPLVDRQGIDNTIRPVETAKPGSDSGLRTFQTRLRHWGRKMEPLPVRKLSRSMGQQCPRNIEPAAVVGRAR